MTSHALILSLLALGLTLLIWNKLRYDIVALILLSIALLLKLVPYESAYIGFINPAVISVICIMIISKAFIHSNVLYFVIEKSSKWMKTQTTHSALMICLTALFSMFMNNVGALSLVLPVATKTSDKYGYSRAGILMPIAFAAALGGMCTAFGTPPNLIISNFRRQIEGVPFSIFDFAPVGLSVAILSALFLIFFSHKIIGRKKEKKDSKNSSPYVFEVVLNKNSLIVGKTLRLVEDKLKFKFPILAHFRNHQLMMGKETVLEIDDHLIVELRVEELEELVHHYKLQFRLNDQKKIRSYHLIEAVVVNGSRMIGRSLKDIDLSKRFGLNVIGVRAANTSRNSVFEKSRLKAGDAILIATEEKTIHTHARYLGILVINHLDPIKEIGAKNFLPFILFAAAILINMFHLLPLHIALSFCVLALILSNSIPLRLIYESVNWPVIVLLGAMMPIAFSFQVNGGADAVSHLFINKLSCCHPVLLLSFVMLMTILLSDLINNTATALIMAPIAMDLALDLGLNVNTFLMAVSVGASCSFATPIGHQNNLIVYNIGKYEFKDYLKLGLPLEALIMAIGVPALLLFWPIYS